jgi:dephospho-CoA kinase
MLKVGLTGSIAVGKSFVCEVLSELGCLVLDADKTVRDVVKPQTKGLKSIVEHFGKEILQPNGELDRARLGAIIFNNGEKRQLLNSLVHPLVIEAQNKWLQEVEESKTDEIAVIDAALMIESGSFHRFDKIIVVWCAAEIQIERLMRRSNLSFEEASKRIGAQMPQEEKKIYADFLIDTTTGFEETRRQTTKVFEQLRLLVTNQKF